MCSILESRAVERGLILPKHFWGYLPGCTKTFRLQDGKHDRQAPRECPPLADCTEHLIGLNVTRFGPTERRHSRHKRFPTLNPAANTKIYHVKLLLKTVMTKASET
jgi:hypothetical protein